MKFKRHDMCKSLSVVPDTHCMLNYDGPHDKEAETHCWSLCPLPQLHKHHWLLERRGPQRSSGASIPLEAQASALEQNP